MIASCVVRSIRGVTLQKRWTQLPQQHYWKQNLHRSFSAQEATESEDFRFALNFASLGLEHRLVYPYLHSIQQLPEIDAALQDGPSNTPEKAIENVKRGIQVFEMMQKGGNEHIASLAILAEFFQRQGRYDKVHKILSEQIEPLMNASSLPDAATTSEITLARAKSLWYMGNFKEAESCCDQLVESDEIDDLPIHYASALTGIALSRLLQCEKLDGAFAVRDPFRMVVKFLERHPQYGSLPLAAANLNFGVSEAVYADIVGRENDVVVPMDSSLRAWKKGISILSRQSGSSAIATSVEARLQSNMAWGVLQIQDRNDNLKRASEFAAKGLSLCDSSSEEDNGFLRRSLAVVAECYFKADQAVTAEGLYQSSVNSRDKCIGPLAQLELSHACTSYSKLCQQWEKREADAEKLKERSKEIDENLPEEWKGKPGIVSSLWFWTPNLLL